MASRLELQSKLEELLGSRNVYYQPPESVKLNYPAIIYSKSNLLDRFANDKRYTKLSRYAITVVIDAILDLPYCSFDRHYTADNLYHDTLSLYY